MNKQGRKLTKEDYASSFAENNLSVYLWPDDKPENKSKVDIDDLSTDAIKVVVPSKLRAKEKSEWVIGILVDDEEAISFEIPVILDRKKGRVWSFSAAEMVDGCQFLSLFSFLADRETIRLRLRHMVEEADPFEGFGSILRSMTSAMKNLIPSFFSGDHSWQFTLSILDDDEKHIRICAETHSSYLHGTKDRLMHTTIGMKWSLGEVAKELTKGKSVISTDTEEDDEKLKWLKEPFGIDWNVKSLIVVPILGKSEKLRRKLIGAFGINTYGTSNILSEDILHLAERVAGRISSTLEHALKYKKPREELEGFGKLVGLSSSARTIEDAFIGVLEMFIRFFDVEAGILRIKDIDEEQGEPEFFLVAAEGFGKKAVKGMCPRSKEKYEIEYPVQRKHPGLNTKFLDRKLKYYWSLPLLKHGSEYPDSISKISDASDDVFGRICLFSKKPINVSDTLIKRAFNFARHAMELIENTLGTIVGDTTQDLHERISGVTKSQEFLDTMVARIKDILSAEACTIFLQDESGKYLEPAASTKEDFKPEEVIEEECYEIEGDAAEKHLTAKVFICEESICCNYVTEWHGRRNVVKPRFDDVGKPEIDEESFLGVPFRSTQGKTIGAIRCSNKKGERAELPESGFFNSYDVRILEAVSKQMTTTYSLLRHYEQRAIEQTILHHELSNPLMLLGDGLELIERRLRSETIFERIERPLKNTKSSVELVKILNRNAVAMYDEKPRLTIECVEMYGQVISQVCGLLAPHAHGSGRAVEYNYNEIRQFPDIYIDRNCFLQMLYNVLLNGIKYSTRPEKKPVQIITRSLKDRLVMLITDYGIGVIEGEEEKIFGFQFRGSNARKNFMGRGLGLYVTRKLLEKFGGVIWLSKRRNPTTFTIELPKGLLSEGWPEDGKPPALPPTKREVMP